MVKAERDYTKEDTNKVKLLNEIAFYQMNTNPDIVNDLHDEKGNATGTEIRIDIPVE